MAYGSALIPVASASDLEAAAQRSSAEKQATPMIQGLASHTRHRWEVMRDHKRLYVEDRLTKCVRARDMEYEPEKLAEIREQGGSEIFMGIVSTKCRTATAWLRDTLLGSGTDKPWSISPHRYLKSRQMWRWVCRILCSRTLCSTTQQEISSCLN